MSERGDSHISMLVSSTRFQSHQGSHEALSLNGKLWLFWGSVLLVGSEKLNEVENATHVVVLILCSDRKFL